MESEAQDFSFDLQVTLRNFLTPGLIGEGDSQVRKTHNTQT